MFGKKFEMKKMKDYQDLYLKQDILLEIDVQENFRNNSSKNYGLFELWTNNGLS